MPECSCIKGNFDVYIDFLDCKTLLIEDMSDWMDEGYYTKATSYELEILTPNRPRVYKVQIDTDRRNRFSPSDIGIGGENFNDGIYCFTVNSCGHTYKRNKLIACSIECCIEDAVSKISTTEEIFLLDEIRLLLDSAKINTEIGNLTKSKEQYSMVTKMLRRLNCSCK